MAKSEAIFITTANTDSTDEIPLAIYPEIQCFLYNECKCFRHSFLTATATLLCRCWQVTAISAT